MANKGIFKLYPLVPLCFCLILGISISHSVGMAVNTFYWAAVFLIFFVITLLLRGKPTAQSLLILFSMTLLGCLYQSIAERDSNVALPEDNIVYEGVIESEPVERGKILRFDMIVASGPLAGKSVRISLLKDTIENHYASLTVGDCLQISSKLERPSNFCDSNFDYVVYLKSHGIVATSFVFYNRWSKVNVSLSRLSVYQRAKIVALKYRHNLLQRYKSLGLEGQGFAVVAAMTLGDKSALSVSTRDVYSITGASHILALSGMHLGIIYALLSVLSLGRRLQIIRECLLLITIWVYVFLVGFSPSVLRSALMISVYALVRLSGRGTVSLNTLAFAAIILLLVNPFVLYDIGFQLSFTAVAFILMFNTSVSSIISYRFQQKHRFLKWGWQMLVMSFLAQAGTMPLIIYYFDRIPVYSLFVNFFVIPASIFILYSSVIIFALSFIPILQQLIAWLLSFVVSTLNFILSNMASWPYASISGFHFGYIQVFLLYVIMLCLCWLIALYGNLLRKSRFFG